MKKLKNKIYLLLTIIFSIFLLVLLILFNSNIYSNEYKKIISKIGFIENRHDKFMLNDNFMKNPIFFDTNVYIVSVTERGNIKNVINYSNEEKNTSEIVNIFNSNIDRINNGDNSLFNKYLFFRSSIGDIIIVDNSVTQDFLKTNIIQSLIFFVLIEMIILYLSYILTKWVAKPAIESFEKQKQFIYDASHELKTPIAIIMASAETLEDNPKEKKWLNNIKEETERMNKLVLNLLNLSKIEESDDKIIYSKINLSKLINNKAISFESLMFENKLSLETNIEDNIELECNPDRMKELISILLDNAIKHGYKDSKIVVKLYKDKNNIYLEVINNGDEIQIQDRTKIFERFYRVDKSRNRNEGRYGLGLAIAKNIVEQHNGNIDVDCKNGYTTFKVILKKK